MNFTNRTFGIEIEAKGLTFSSVEQLLANEGLDVYQTNYMDHSTSSTRWKVKPDGSVSNGFEVVSPILQGEAGIAQVRLVLDTLDRAGAFVDKQCGIHVHFGVSDWGLKEFKNIFKQYIKYETALDAVQPRSRRENNGSYCQGFTHVTNAQWFERIDRCRDLSNLRYQLGMDVYSRRYRKLNIDAFWAHGTIEFRHHAGSLSSQKVEAWLRLCSGMMQQADALIQVRGWGGGFQEGYTAEYKLGYLLERLLKNKAIDTATSRYMKKRARAFGYVA